MSLTPEEIDTYLTEVLHYKNWREEFETSRENGVEFITRIFQAWLINIPFHNVGILQDSEDLDFTSEQDVVDKVLSGKFVMCAGNIFLKCLYSSLGFNSFLIPSILNNRSLPSSTKDDSTNNEETTSIIHLTVGVQCPQTSFTYFIDIGSGVPITEPIPLHDLPYRRSVGGFSFEFRKDSFTGRTQLVELEGNLITGKFAGNQKEWMRYSFDGIPLPFVKVLPNIQLALEQTKKCSRALSLSRFIYIKDKVANDQEGFKFISICGNWVAIIEGESKRNLLTIKDKSQLSSFVISTFPTLNVADITSVLS